jgi:hypothetical protein
VCLSVGGGVDVNLLPLSGRGLGDVLGDRVMYCCGAAMLLVLAFVEVLVDREDMEDAE